MWHEFGYIAAQFGMKQGDMINQFGIKQGNIIIEVAIKRYMLHICNEKYSIQNPEALL